MKCKRISCIKQSCKTKRTIIFVAILYVLVISVGIRFLLHEHYVQYYKWADDARSRGPWADQAIWISSDKDMYLICVKEDSNQFASINAYVLLNGDWIPCDLNWIPGTKKIEFSEKARDEIMLSGEFKVKDNSFTIEKISESSAHNFSHGRSSILLSKYLYDQQITQLPFDFKM